MHSSLEAELDRFHLALEERWERDLVTLAVFGSRAQGRERGESDLDLLVVIEGLPRRRLERHAVILELAHGVSDEFAEIMSAIPLTPDEARTIKPYYLGFLEGHRLLVDRDGFFRRILDRLEQRLRELGSRRLVDELGNPYWDLKPDYVLGEDIVL
jgi:predicted nucleotidyltransferase